MAENDIQNQLFNQIKDRLPENLSLVDEIADLLEISNDSAYRRIRGDKALEFEELGKLAKHFKISLDDSLQVRI